MSRGRISRYRCYLTIFTFIGIALLFTFVAGMSFGGVEDFCQSTLIRTVFDRAEDMEIIQLKLIQGLTRRNWANDFALFCAVE